jgi:hypothetical protein
MTTLLPPTVGERLSQCSTEIEVWGITPGAAVTLDISGATQTTIINGTNNTFIVPGLSPNAQVRAMQQLGADQSGWSNVVNAELVALPPAPPFMEPSLSRCVQSMSAWGVSPGSKVEVLHGAAVIAGGLASREGKACMKVTQRTVPATSCSTQTTTCGTVSPSKGSVTITQPPNEVPPPQIARPPFYCQTGLNFEHLLPGATYEVWLSEQGVQRSLGTFTACFAVMFIDVGHRFDRGDSVWAVGAMENLQWECHVRGQRGAAVDAVEPDDRIKPVIEEPVWEGDSPINVSNQIEGGTITLMRKTDARSPQEETLGSRPSSKNAEVSVGTTLNKDNVIWIIQELCGQKRSSDPVTVKGIPREIPEVQVRKPVFACAGMVIVDKVIPGATVWLWQVPKGLPGPFTLFGKQKSLGSTAFVNVYPSPASGNEVFAKQEISGKFSGPSGRVEVTFQENVPAPQILGPVFPKDTEIWCDGLLVGAYVRLLATISGGLSDITVQIGSGTAYVSSQPINVWFGIPQSARVTATQMLCREGPPSREERVGLGQPCDGPPVWEPWKWNDPAHIQLNNCYNYGCDLLLDNFAQPGGGGLPRSDCQCDIVTARAKSDGLKDCSAGACHPCHHKVALVMAPGTDYHWYRQERHGAWTHKPGPGSATVKDNSNQHISNPETADRGRYTQFCGYFCVYKPNVHLRSA